MTTPIRAALDILLKEGIISDDSHPQAAIATFCVSERSREDLSQVVENLGLEIPSKHGLRAGVYAQESETYNKYLLLYLSFCLVQNKGQDTQPIFKQICAEANNDAINATFNRLYGSLKWVDEVETTKVAESTGSGPAKGHKQANKPRGNSIMTTATTTKRNRVKEIHARIVELHNANAASGMSLEDNRKNVLAAITSEFAITTAITAVTYRNDALKAAGLSTHKPRAPKAAAVVAAPATTATTTPEASVAA